MLAVALLVIAGAAAGARVAALLGQLAASYIVAEGPDGLYLIDQHAAHERLTLERMNRALAGGRVAKGMRMAGRMGSDRVTVTNLKVLVVDAKAGKLIVSGAVPGRRGTLLAEDGRKHIQGLLELPRLMEQTLEMENAVAELARERQVMRAGRNSLLDVILSFEREV